VRCGLLDHSRHDRARGCGEVFHGKGALTDERHDAQAGLLPNARLAVQLYRI